MTSKFDERTRKFQDSVWRIYFCEIPTLRDGDRATLGGVNEEATATEKSHPHQGSAACLVNHHRTNLTVPLHECKVEVEDLCLSICKNCRTSAVQVQPHLLDDCPRQGQPAGEPGIYNHVSGAKDLVAASDFDHYPSLKTSGAIG